MIVQVAQITNFDEFNQAEKLGIECTPIIKWFDFGFKINALDYAFVDDIDGNIIVGIGVESFRIKYVESIYQQIMESFKYD